MNDEERHVYMMQSARGESGEREDNNVKHQGIMVNLNYSSTLPEHKGESLRVTRYLCCIRLFGGCAPALLCSSYLTVPLRQIPPSSLSFHSDYTYSTPSKLYMHHFYTT